VKLARQGAEDLVLLGEPPRLVLGEDQLAVHEHVELPGGAGLERAVEAKLLLDRRRETRSARFVVSDVAVLDQDLLAHDRNHEHATPR
jgi:hypothetical protein